MPTTYFVCITASNPFPSHWMFCQPMPVFLAESLHSFSSVKNSLSGLKTWSLLLDLSVEPFPSTDLILTLRGFNQNNQHMLVSKLPLLPTDLIPIVKLLDIYDHVDACLWVFFTFAYFSMIKAF